MKKIRFLMFVMVLISSLFASEDPKWLTWTQDKDAKYFLGVSTWYIVDDALVESASHQDALNNGYAQVSSYFGLNIKSELDVQSHSSQGKVSRDIKEKIHTKTNQLIFDLKPYKTYKKLSENGKYFQLYVLLRLDHATELKIKEQMKKDQQEFKLLKQKILKAIDEKDLYKARTLLELAKGKRAAFIDDTLLQIEKRLQSLEKGSLQADISIEKTVFAPNEDISFEVNLNKDGYLYVFYDNTSEVEMLFPNKYQRRNFLKNKEPVYFPNDDVEVHADADAKELRLYVIASKNRLSFQKYKEDVFNGMLIFSSLDVVKNVALECLSQAHCTQKNIVLKVQSNRKNDKKIIIKSSEKIKQKVKKYLKSQGIVSKKSNKVVSLAIQEHRAYSSLLQSYIVEYDVTLKYFKNAKLIKKQKITSVENELYEDILTLLEEL